jgi:hypothetical protein
MRPSNLLTACTLAALSVTFASQAAHAAIVQWDPSGVGAFASPGGGPGHLNNSTSTFVDSSDTHLPLDTTADAHFAGASAPVDVDAATTARSFNFDVGGYTLSSVDPSDTLTATGGNAVTVLSNTFGSNTVNADLLLSSGGSGTNKIIDIQSGTLTVGKLTSGNYSSITKNGNGTLYVTGALNTSSGHTAQGMDINAGKWVFSTQSNVMAGGRALTVAQDAAISGDTKITLGYSPKGFFNLNGHLAPGNEVAGYFGNVGNFNIQGVGNNTTGAGDYTTFGATSQLDFDLVSPDLDPNSNPLTPNHDVFSMNTWTYGGVFIDIASGATVNINDGAGPLAEGTYHIIQLTGVGPGIRKGVITAADPDIFTIGNAPAGYDYQFVSLGSGTQFTGIDLIVTQSTSPVPEPASLSLLALGALPLLKRRRRHA